MKTLALTLVTLALAGPALADDANKSTCQRPVTPNTQSSDLVIKMYNKRMVAFKACTDKFVEDRRAFGKENATKDAPAAQAAYDAADAAVKEYNAAVDEFNAATKPAEDDKK